MFGDVVELTSEKDYFVNMSDDKEIKSSFFASDDDLFYDSFVPREKGRSYLVKKLPDGKYTIFENFDKSKVFGVKYDKITPISGSLVSNGKCYALKIENNNDTFYVSPIDLAQTKLDNEVQSIIMSSFISDAYYLFNDAVIDLQLFNFLDCKYEYSYKQGLKRDDRVVKISKLTKPPLSNNIDFSHYDSKTCELLAGRFYSLVESFKNSVKNNEELSEDIKNRLFEEFFPEWEENTLRKLFEISQISKSRENGKSLVEIENSLKRKVKNATISVKKEMSEDEKEKIRELLTENTIDNGGTLEYATLTRDVYVTVESEGEILGYAGLVDNGNGKLYIGVIAVKKEYHGLGVGSKMYDFIKIHSKQFSEINADVRSFNANSKRLHTRQGFKIVDRYGDLIDPNNLVYFPSGNIEFNFDLKNIKNRKPLIVGTKMKLSDVEKTNGVVSSSLER